LHDLKANKKQGIVIKLDFEKAYDKIHWKFLFEVLQRKGFSEAWILQIEQVVQSGRVCININGENTSFFRTYKGLRQGDPCYSVMMTPEKSCGV
jgi:hypothetical protein